MADDKLRMEVRDGANAGEKIVTLEGVLNAETAFRFRDAVRGHESGSLVIEMSGVRSMDSSGLGVLIGLYVTCERTLGRLALAGMNERVWEIFRTCKIEDVFTRYRNVWEAEEAMRAAAAAESVTPG